MGKFNVAKLKKKQALIQERQNLRMRDALRRKPLLKPIKDDLGIVFDGELLFGAHKGKNVLELLQGYNTAQYVINYLANNENLPKAFRNQIGDIIENTDPFMEYEPDSPLAKKLNVREVEVEEIDWGDDDIPW